MSILFEKNFQRVFGTWPLTGELAHEAIAGAVSAGYRSFDTAQKYHNEQDVGEALANCDVEREHLCITTKVTTENFTDDKFLPSVEASLAKLDCGPVDLLLLHWPPSDGNVAPSLEMLARARDLGLARQIGVSNYTVAMMRTASEIAGPIATNQVEFHPLLDQSKLLIASKELGIPLSAYCSIARGGVLRQELLAEIGQRHRKSAIQTTLRWIYQHGVAPITKCSSAERAKENFRIDDFELSAEEMESINALGSANHRICNAEVPVGNSGWGWD